MTDLENKLKRFVNEDFREACFDLIKYWQIIYNPIEASEFSSSDFFSVKFASSHKPFINKIDNIELLCVATPDTFLKDKSSIDITEILEKEGYKNMLFFGIEINSPMNRTELSHLTRVFNRINHLYPVILFIKFFDASHNTTSLTLSMCERSELVKTNKDEDETTSLKIGRVTILRDIDCNNPHPGHLNILKKLSVSCNSYDELYSNWLDIFSNELLTKDFYEDLYKWYQWAIEPTTGVTFPNIVGDSKDDQFGTSTSIIRLITRILFVWFIKQKGLVPNELFDIKSLSKVLNNFNPLASNNGDYYNAILQNLFFATLNNPIEQRAFIEPKSEKHSHEGVKTLFRDNENDSWFSIEHKDVLDLFHKIPFMNCGLFECQDKYANADIDTDEDNFMDGFSCLSDKINNHLKYRAFIPNKLFFSTEHQETVSITGDNGKIFHEVIKVSGLLPILNKYQFTVEENTPTDVEVSLDPELLGQVFENLLAAYDPKTRSTARKATGSFYTPRKIVEYMVNESLIEYLNTHVDSSKTDTWRKILGYEDIPFDLKDEERKIVLRKILNCKVLDPACGSGAFPMGMLHQMVHIVRKVDPTNEIWRVLVLERTQQEINKILEERKDIKDGKEELEKRREEVMNAFDNSVDNPDYTRKLYIIQNCIYGSDIQPVAMLISKLRFFISLICEQDTKNLDFNDIAHNYGINTLPNLETKFVAADSLANAKVREYEDDEWTIDKHLVQLKNELLEIRQSHFMANTQEKKLEKRAEDEYKRREIHNYILCQAIKPDESKIRSWNERLYNLKKEREHYEDERFEEVEVITQATLFDEGKTSYVLKDVNQEKRDKIDKEIRALERDIKKEKNKENKAGFTNAVKQITGWNPYDQINPSPFFDPDWMFSVKDGFDIVIGNPPYFQTNKGKYSSSLYPFSEGKDPGKQNMYKLFVEYSYNNAKKDGIACMIVQSSLMCDWSSKNTRELLLKNTCLKQMIEFPKTAPTKKGQVFASVCQGTCIYLFKKTEPNFQPFFLSVNNDCTTLDNMIKENISQESLIRFYPEDYSIPLLHPGEFALLKKIKDESNNLSCYLDDVSQGDLNVSSNKDQYSNKKTSVKLLRGCNIHDFAVDYNVDEFVKESFKRDYVTKNHSHTFIVSQAITGMVDHKRIHCALSSPQENQLWGHSANKTLLKDESQCYYIVGLMNSLLMDWVFRKTSTNNNVNGYELKRLPIIFNHQLELESLVKRIILNKFDGIEDSSLLEKEMDNLVFKIYNLNDDEIEMILNNYR